MPELFDPRAGVAADQVDDLADRIGFCIGTGIDIEAEHAFRCGGHEGRRQIDGNGEISITDDALGEPLSPIGEEVVDEWRPVRGW